MTQLNPFRPAPAKAKRLQISDLSEAERATIFEDHQSARVKEALENTPATMSLVVGLFKQSATTRAKEISRIKNQIAKLEKSKAQPVPQRIDAVDAVELSAAEQVRRAVTHFTGDE
ncbi:hypothetical protein [Shimia sp. MIT1388]|uniref:hypothetical protein n=1 Tax=Shimia sp. MIT1388 TaxID=3096992 RepID=UPI00399AE826